LVSPSQANKEVTVNALADALSPAALYGRRAVTSAGVTFGYYGGTVSISGTPTQIANGEVTLAASATNYVEADPATGAVSVNQTGFTAGRTALHQIVTVGSTVSSHADLRVLGGGSGGSGTVKSVNTKTPDGSGAVTLTASDVGAETSGAASAAITAHEAASDPHSQYQKEAEKGAANGYASLDSGGKLPTSQLPNLAIIDFLGTVANQTAMLALTGEKGDWCARSDNSKVYVITGSDPTSIGSWTALSYPTGTGGTVTSVDLSVPGVLYTVSGNPVTGSGTLTFTLKTQTANTFLAGPVSGAAATPTMRAIVAADLPVMGASGTGHAGGAVPDPGSTAGATRFLREDGSWSTPASSSTASSSDITAFTGGFAKWQAAKARGSANPARFAFIGDSNVAGEGSGTSTRGLTGAVKTSLARKFAVLGGYQTDSFFGEQNVTFAPSVALGAYDDRITLGSGWAPDSSVSGIFGGRFLLASGGSSGRLSFAPTGAFNRFRVWYPTLSGLNSSVGVYVDNVLVGTLNQNGAAGFTFAEYSVTSGVHTISIGVGATGSGYVAGIETFSGASTPVFLQGGYCAAVAADLDATGNPWNGKPGTLAIAPDYAAIYCTINDARLTGASSYYASMEDLVAALAPTVDGCLCVGYPYNAVGATDGTYDKFAQLLKNMAADYGWSYFDGRRVYGRSYVKATAKAYTYDAYHPNAAGANAFAADLYAFLNAAGL
jgi:hypothetical protein